MKNVIQEYKNEVSKLLNNKKYTLSIILVTILGYGYFITHVTIGMDDTCLDRYYGDFFGENMICAGRWGSYFLYKLLGIITFTPFWLETLTIFLFIVTAILISSFINKNLHCKDIKISIIFSTIYLSYSLINEPFIFQPSNLALTLSNLLVFISLIIIYEEIYLKKNKYSLLYTIPIITIAISLYEACCQTFLVGLLISALINIVIYKEDSRRLFKHFTVGIGILACSIILNYVILYIFYSIGVPNELSGGRTFFWFDYGIFKGIAIIINNIYYYTIKNIRYFPVLEFTISALVGFVISIYYAIKKKNINILSIYILMFFSNFALAILQCREILYRTCTSWGLFVAAIITATFYILSQKKCLKSISIILVILIILWQTRDLNQWFYSEYIKYQRDLKDGYQIADDIIKETKGSTKSIVFVGIPAKVLQTAGQIGAQSNGLSVVWWGQKAFEDNSYELIKFINSLGYNFRKPTDDEYQKGIKLSEGMANYPKEGYIKEFEEIIVVKFN